MEWHEEARRLKAKGKTVQEIAEHFGVSFGAANKAVYGRGDKKKTKTLRGQEERIPKVHEFDEYYKVTSGERSVEITKDNLRKLKQLYCETPRLTINQICRKMEIPRRDFILIKTAFSITHDDVPYIDEDLKNKDVDDLTAETLERKKEKYFVLLGEKEIAQAFKELEQYRKQDYFINKIHRVVTEHFKEFNACYEGPMVPLRTPNTSGKMLEVSIVDLHLGKLAWAPETGENYDHRIAEHRFMAVIYDILERTKGKTFDKILFPIGQDFFNFDTIDGNTTAGTRQDNDVRWQKLFAKGTELLIRAIDILKQLAPVDVFVVPGNHDTQTSFYAIMTLEAWFHNDKNVTVDTDPKARKYREFGKCLIGFTHADKERKRIFGCMQVEARESWGRTLFQEWHGAHLHSEQVKEDMGVIVRNLSSVTGLDAWHYQSGYVGAIAKSQSFIWDREKGLQEILLTTIER